jgi:hypothetical protein
MTPSRAKAPAAAGAQPAKQLLAAVATVLTVNGRVPRRAVLLPDGGLGDRAQHPELPEVELLSRLCELGRQATGQARYPRRTEDLLGEALASNAPGAWDALKDDVFSGDVDFDAAAAYLRAGASGGRLVACLVGARDGGHAANVCLVASKVVPLLPAESREEVGRALSCQLRAAVDALARTCAFMTTEVRDAVLTAFGRLLGFAPGAGQDLADLVESVLGQRRDELLLLFLHVPLDPLAHRPRVVAGLLERARAAPAAARPVVLAMLARLAAHRPEAVAAHRADVTAAAVAALGAADPDTRTFLAAANLVKLCADGATAQLAEALRVCAAALHARQTDA